MKRKSALIPVSLIGASLLPSGAQPIITEIADPDNSAGARFVEVYNPTGAVIDLSLYEITRWTNASSSSQSPIALTGNLAPGDFILYVANSTTFNNTYSGVTATIVQLGTGGPADSNGDDNIALRLASDNSIVDVFGIPGTDGSGTAHEFENGRAERVASSTTPASTWNAADWNVDNDSGGGDGAIDAPAGFDPGSWIGEVAAGPSIVVSTTASTIDENTTDADLVQVSLSDASGLSFPLNVTLTAGPAGKVNLNGTIDSTVLAFTADTDTFDVSVEALDDMIASPDVQVNVTAAGTGLAGGNASFDVVDDEVVSTGDIVITEIMQNPVAVDDSDGEWFEVYNAAAFSIDLNGWTIGTENHLINNGGPLTIAPGQYLVFGVNADIGTNGGVTVDYEYSSVTLGNGSDTLTLSLPSSSEIDRVEWDNGSTFPDPTGASMALDLPSSDNNVGANWSISSSPFGDGDLGSPGAVNPAPATFTLGLNNNPISESAGFSASTLTITRSNTSGDLEVTISGDDPSELQAQSSTVLILDGDADETVDLDAIDDLWEDGDQVITISVSAPGYTGASQTITVQDDADVNALIINEVYQGPDGNLGDANGDSVSPTFDDEFIEIVNVGATPYDLSFCSIIENGFDLNARGPVHFFPEGTVLAPGAALVVFAGGDISNGSTAAFGTAEIQKATEGGLFLSDGGENVRLRDSFDQELFGVLLPDVSGASSTDSLTLSPDLDTTSPFVSHSSLPSSIDFSPGTEIDGTTPFVTITDTLGLTVNTANVGEEAGTAPAAITVSLPSPAAADTIIRLESSNEDELFIQDTVTISSGTSSVTVDVFPVSDDIDDGDQVVAITASLSGFLNASGNLTVVDDDETFSDLVINEVDADTVLTDDMEFVELYNRTNQTQSLDGLVLVFFNGSDNRSYGDAIDLTGQTIEPNGFFVIGNSAVTNVDLIVSDDSIQNGADAVALFKGAAATSYPNDTPVATAPGTLVDAIVYGTNDSDNLTLITALTPGNPQVDESSGSVGSDSESSSRVPDGGTSFDTNLFVIQAPTPGATNVLLDDDYSTWAAEQVPPVGGPDVDDDLDGIANLVEYALGLDPNVADGAPGTLAGGTLTFVKGADAKANGDLIYEIETSNDLGVTDAWAVDGSAVDGADDISIDLFTAGGVETKFFARLKVSQLIVVE